MKYGILVVCVVVIGVLTMNYALGQSGKRNQDPVGIVKTRWEYKVVKIELDNLFKGLEKGKKAEDPLQRNIEKILNRQAQNGWEYVETMEGVGFLFKRKK